jgi:hypothetical protein
MIPPVFSIAAANSGVTALLGSNPTRLYPFGEAPQTVAKPYAVWQTVVGLPENYIGQAPDIDLHSVQVDVYADTASSALAVATALRNAYQAGHYVTSFRTWPREPETNLYRVTLEVDFWQSR